jgi:putative transposase
VYEELKHRILLEVKILPDQQPTRIRHMTNDNIVALNTPAQDVLSELLKTEVQQLLTQAIEADVAKLIAQHICLMTESGLHGIVRNDVKIPKVRDRTGQGIKFNSGLVPPYLKGDTHPVF